MMKNQSVRLWIVAFSGIGILTLFWGYRSISTGLTNQQQTLEQSLDQELISLSSAVQASVQAIRWQMVDVLKAEASERMARAEDAKPSRVFSNSIFSAIGLLEAGESSWKVNWLTVAPPLQSSINAKVLRERFAEWNQNNVETIQFHRLPDVSGLHYFAAVMPVIKGASRMMAVGIFQPSQFSLALSQAHTREVKVVNEAGYALALSHPAYLGSSLRHEIFMKELLSQDALSLRKTFKDERSKSVVAAGQRLADSNLFVVIEAPLPRSLPFVFKTLLFLLLSAGSAGAITWWLLRKQFADLVQLTFQLSEQVDQMQMPATKVAPVKPVLSQFSASQDQKETIPAQVLKAPGVIEKVVEVVKQPKPIDQILKGTIERLQKKYQNENVEVESFGLTELKCAGDEGQIKAALDEILKNAFEAVTDPSQIGIPKKISIFGERHDGYIRLSVSDSGPGIAPENLAKVFDPFYSTKTTGTAARGLGLNVVRRVVEEIKGRVDIFSEGHGTRVELTLPTDAEVGLPQQDLSSTQFQMLNLDFDELEKQEIQTKRPKIDIRKPKVRFLD